MHYHKRKKLRKTFQNLTRIIPSLFWLLLIFSFDKPYFGILTVICALIHEGGHILASVLLGGSPELSAFALGFRLKSGRLSSYRDDILITLSGPLANLAIGIPVLIFFGTAPYPLEFGIINIFTALSNLLPVYGYDGYRILKLLLEERLREPELPLMLLSAVSSAVISVFCFLSLYLMAKLNSGYWIFIVFIFALIKSLARDERVFL